ncbi:hypothetical protein HYS93_02840 [Candidatus Daviesbacteria bacterium]|nr:hypothetical protein [Candidatus Daviesbacteria bacterium]
MATAVPNWIGTTQSIIAHSLFFVGIFALYIFGFNTSQILLILTTAVSLEAIYLAIFIQMTVNRNTKSLIEVEENIDEIQEDVEDIQEDVEGLESEVEEIQAEEDQDEVMEEKTKQALDNIEGRLQKLLEDIESLKKSHAH